MLTDKEWEEVRYDLIETGFFDFEARPKTLRAVRLVVDKMHDDQIEKLRERTSIIFAPAPAKYGEVYPFKASSPAENQSPRAKVRSWFIYHQNSSAAIKSMFSRW
jgi:hypothetical protein